MAQRKKKLQYSKIVTSIVLSIITITWLIGLIRYWSSIEYFNYILDYTQAMALGVLPYFCLSAVDRIVYWQEAKNKGGKER